MLHVLSLWLWFPFITDPVAQPSPQEVVAKVQNYYQSVSSLGAKFRQEFTNTTIGTTKVDDGTVTIAKPGKMRWNYKTPDEKYFITDGTVLWAIDVNNQQAVKQDMKGQLLPVAVTFLYGQGNIAQEFDASACATAYGDAGDECVDLTPKTPTADYKKVSLVVDPSDGHVKDSIVLDGADNTNHFKFRDVRANNNADAASTLYVVNPADLSKRNIHIIDNPNQSNGATP
jgi:outer membrane lipoprotein carrier protein